MSLVLYGALALAAVGALWFLLKTKLRPPTTLDPKNKVHLKLIEKVELSHNVRRFRFGLPSSAHVLGLPVGKHVILSATVDGKPVSRPYTPTSSEADNFMDIVLKVYFANEHPKFPSGGVMSQYMESLNVGDSIAIRGPLGKYEYAAPGTLTVKKAGGAKAVKKVKHLGLIAGGTGITPMLAIAQQVLSDPNDQTQLSLIFANNSEADIFMREELEALAERHPNFKLWYTLTETPENWTYSKGYISVEMIKHHLPVDKEDSAFLVCGPPPMVKFACLPHLASCNVPEENILVW